jgi:hypothetical protein
MCGHLCYREELSCYDQAAYQIEEQVTLELQSFRSRKRQRLMRTTSGPQPMDITRLGCMHLGSDGVPERQEKWPSDVHVSEPSLISMSKDAYTAPSERSWSHPTGRVGPGTLALAVSRQGTRPGRLLKGCETFTRPDTLRITASDVAANPVSGKQS